MANKTHLRLTLLIVLLAAGTKQALRRVKEFQITKIEKNSVQTKKRLSAQLAEIKINSQLSYTGTANLLGQISPKKLEIRISYREPNADFKSTRILRISFPFTTESKYTFKDLYYTSVGSEGVANDYKLDEADIQHQDLDQEFYIFTGKDLQSGYKLKSIFAHINIITGDDGDGGIVHVPDLKDFEVFFEDERFVYHLQITDQMFGPDEISDVWPIISLVATVFSAAILPSLTFSKFVDFFKNSKEEMIFSASQCFYKTLVLSGLILLAKKGRSFTSISLILAMILILACFCCLRIAFHFGVVSKHLKTKTKNPRILGYIVVLVLAQLVWLILLFFDFLIIFRSFFMYSFLVIIDLIFLKMTISLKRKVAWQAWLMVMMQMVYLQACIYGFYFYCFWAAHKKAPSLLLYNILPDFGLLVLMIIPFHFRFKFGRNSRRVAPRQLAKVKYSSIGAEIAPIIFQGDRDWGQFFKDNPPKTAKYTLRKHRNVPINRRNKFRAPWKTGDTIENIFNFSNKQPFLTKDHLAIGRINSRPGIRYVVNQKKAWDLVLKNNNESTGNSVFVENVFLGNQNRRDMMAYVNKVDRRVRLVSLTTRKVILNQKLADIPHNRPPSKTKETFCLVFLRPQNRPLLLTFSDQNIFIESCLYNNTSKRATLYQSQKMKELITERNERKLLEGRDVDIFDNLVAVKYLWVDRADYDRDLINEAKYQFISIYEIREDGGRIKEAKNLRKITEDVFSAYRIDSFFFLDKSTLAMIMDAKVFLIDWRQATITTSFEIADLYSPLVKNGIEKEKLFASYWYKKSGGVVRFSVGIFQGGVHYGKKDINRYITNLDLVDVHYYYSGWFAVKELAEGGMDTTWTGGAAKGQDSRMVATPFGDLGPRSRSPAVKPERAKEVAKNPGYADLGQSWDLPGSQVQGAEGQVPETWNMNKIELI